MIIEFGEEHEGKMPTTLQSPPMARRSRGERGWRGAQVAPKSGQGPKYHERALLRGLQILTAFTIQQPEHDLGSLSTALGLSKATLVRLLDCLRFAGFVDFDARSGTYRLGLRAFEVGSVYQQTSSLEQISRPVLTQLAHTTGQSTNLAVLDQGQVVHVCVVRSPRPIHYVGYVGLRDDAYCTALGKVLLAALEPGALDTYLRQVSLRPRTPNTITSADALRRELDEVARRGYAIDNEEGNLGLRCVAAPVRPTSGTTVAAVSASGPAAEFEGANLQTIITAVTGAAAELGTRLGPSFTVPGNRLL